ncbi:MAG: hypothetical protein ACRD2A_25595, partial [Vicinamibacterales bacterium]
PDEITQRITRWQQANRTRYDAFYVQDQWTRSRLTLQGALRYDHAWSYFPEAQVGPVRFFPTPVIYPETTGVEGYHDLTPRGGVAIDVFGTGKTSLKVSAGRYLEAAQNGGLFTALNPTGRLSTTTTRQWTDANGNFVADCNLNNPGLQDLRASGGDWCAANVNANFGREVFESTLDPALLSGWGVRSGDWQVGVSVQQELLPRVSVEAGYFRRWLVNFIATDNRSRNVVDFTEFGVNVPADSRLPNGGGGVLSGLYDVTPIAAARLNDNLVTQSKNYGNESQVANSVNLNVIVRPRNGLSLQGGFNAGKTNLDRCEIRATLPEENRLLMQIRPSNPWCAYSTEFFR